MINAVLLLCLLGTFEQQSQKTEKEFREKLASDAYELDVKRELLIADGLPIEKIALGSVFTARKYFFSVTLTNATDSPTRVVDLKTTCGCMVGYKQDEELAPGESTDITIVISPQKKVGKLLRRITASTANGSKIQFLVEAEVSSAYTLQPRFVSVEDFRRKRIPFELKYEGGFSGKNVNIRSIGDFLILENFCFDEAERTIRFDGLLTKEALHSVTLGDLIERLQLVDSESGEQVQELPVVLRKSVGLVSRPSTLIVRNSSSKMEKFCSFILVGDVSKIAALQKSEMKFELLAKEEVLCENKVEIVSSTAKTIHCRVAIKDSRIGSEKNSLSARLVDSEGGVHLRFTSVVF